MKIKLQYLFILTFVLMFIGFLLGKICCKSSSETESAPKNESIETVICDSEHKTVDGKLFRSEARLYTTTFTNAYTRNNEYSYSGNYSVKLHKRQQYGMTYRVYDLQMGERFRVGINRLSANGSGYLVVSAKDTKDFYMAIKEAKPTEKRDWERIEFEIEIPEKLIGKKISIYPWNPDTIVPVYFDDLEVSYLGFADNLGAN